MRRARCWWCANGSTGLCELIPPSMRNCHESKTNQAPRRSRARCGATPMNRPALMEPQPQSAVRSPTPVDTAFGCPRDFLDNRFVYTVVSPRARGLSVGVNLNPDKHCNFDCLYCEVNRAEPARETHLDVSVMVAELERTLELVRSGRLREHPYYRNLPDELLKLRHVALSGDGEPTLCPNFGEAVEAVIHL